MQGGRRCLHRDTLPPTGTVPTSLQPPTSLPGGGPSSRGFVLPGHPPPPGTTPVGSGSLASYLTPPAWPDTAREGAAPSQSAWGWTPVGTAEAPGAEGRSGGDKGCQHATSCSSFRAAVRTLCPVWGPRGRGHQVPAMLSSFAVKLNTSNPCSCPSAGLGTGAGRRASAGLMSKP